MNRIMLMAAVVSLLAAGAFAQPATTQKDGSDLEELIRQAEEAVEQKPKVEPGQTGEATDEPPVEEEEDDLATLLLKKAGASGKPIMHDILDNMAASRSQLREKYDPGLETQKIQAKIIRDLDTAIERAQQASSSSSSSSSSSQSQGQGQRQGQKPGQGQQPGQPQTNRGNQAAQDSTASHGSVQEGQRNNVIDEQRARWGDLPPRDRDDVVQGQNEPFLPRWRAAIEKYYTALQVQSQKKD